MNIWLWLQIAGFAVLIIALAVFVLGAVSKRLAPFGLVSLTVYGVGFLVMFCSAICEHTLVMDHKLQVYTPGIENQKPAIVKE